MIPTDCAKFEAELAALLASPEGGDPARVDALRRHAAGCPGCRGALDLVELGAAPADLRDPIPDPGPRYWSELERHLAERLERERSAARRGSRVARAAVVVASAAAVAALALIVRHREPAPEIARTVSGVPGPLAQPAPAPPPEPPHRDRSETASGESAVDTGPGPSEDEEDAFSLGASADPFAEVDDPGLFPRLDDLDAAQAAALSAWLEQEERRVKRGAA